MLFIEGVQGADVVLQFSVLIIVQQHPVQLLCLVPLGKLTELLSHEQQLFARMTQHERISCLQIGKLLLVIAGHLIDEAALAVDDFVVADGQHKILAESVEEAESDLAMVASTEERVGLHVAEHIVHPAHVPLEVEA